MYWMDRYELYASLVGSWPVGRIRMGQWNEIEKDWMINGKTLALQLKVKEFKGFPFWARGTYKRKLPNKRMNHFIFSFSSPSPFNSEFQFLSQVNSGDIYEFRSFALLSAVLRRTVKSFSSAKRLSSQVNCATSTSKFPAHSRKSKRNRCSSLWVCSEWMVLATRARTCECILSFCWRKTKRCDECTGEKRWRARRPETMLEKKNFPNVVYFNNMFSQSFVFRQTHIHTQTYRK